MKNATLIYNPIAGREPARRAEQIRKIADALRARSIAAKPTPTTHGGTATDLARAAVQAGDDLILVCGGDGTLNEVINGMAPANVPLAILPGGTANIAAKELRLPHDPLRAACELVNWSPRRLALGLATGPSGARRYFFSVAGVGFDAYVIQQLSSSFKMSAGVAAYVLEALRQVWRYSFPRFRCGIEGEPRQATFAVIHRTSRYAGWLHLAPGANLWEPRLSLCLFKSAHRLRYFAYAAAVLARQHLRLSDVELVETRKVECAASEPGTRIYFELDGELAGELPASFEVVPDALTVLVP